ncbi:hypothetical protein TNCT_712571 [Trichonephila clavata]|uniref:Uncharacterized protein n=1 Tax=Trichonephila clavata TaxID=2740835 RepID=A0A8X6L1D2_TRICU|nr:hypothetical protein TNCT_712571 [Trichonephila clavata]
MFQGIQGISTRMEFLSIGTTVQFLTSKEELCVSRSFGEGQLLLSLIQYLQQIYSNYPNPTTSRSITPPMEYSHITVLNKEYVDQKPEESRGIKIN